MKIIRTHVMNPSELSTWERDQVYNGLDCCVTRDCLDAMEPQLDDTTRRTYEFSKSLQAPVLEMRARGVLIDQARRSEVLSEFYRSIDRLEEQLERIVYDGLGLDDFNWKSPKHLQNLLYNVLDLPPIRKQGRPTTDRGAREKLLAHPFARPILNHLNLLADIHKKITVLKTEIDDDGRIRTSYNIAGTNTGRFSSSLNEFGTGGNLQNIEESLRSILIADPKMKFAKFDAKSGESFCVGAIEWNLFNDPTYLDVCESGDPHTAVARLVWPNLGWTGALSHDKALAETPFYRHYTHRFMCKKLGHGSNYGGKPATLAEQAKISIDPVRKFQETYFKVFPAHQQWQQWVDATLRERGCITSLLGRKRWFFGRRNESSTLREAIAYDPQSSLADIVNSALIKIWRLNICPIVMHDHDALTFMYRESDEARILPILARELIIPVPLARGRTLRIPYDCKVGWNKGEYDAGQNPNGLRDWNGKDDRTRQKTPGILDRRIRRADG